MKSLYRDIGYDLPLRLWTHGFVVRKIAGKEKPTDLYTKHLESKAKIEQLVGLFGGKF